MNIWTAEPKNTDGQSRTPVIESSKPKNQTLQCIIEEAVANSIYAHIAWDHHKNDHMFTSAINNLLLIPLQKISPLHNFPSVVEITTTDLKFFKMHAKKFKRALKKINDILNNRACAHVVEESEKYGPADPVMLLEITVIY